MTPATADDPGDRTIAAYGAIAAAYAERTRIRAPAVVAFIAELAARVPRGVILELGSASGVDADLLEEMGPVVRRTDATPAFVSRLRAAGHDAARVDVRRDPLGGPYDGVLANAVLLHLTTAEFHHAVARIRAATRPGGVFALSLKEGGGSGWSTVGDEPPRWFTYWREAQLRDALEDAGWVVESLQRASSDQADWLQVLARRPPG